MVFNNLNENGDKSSYVIVDGEKVGVEYLTFSYLTSLPQDKGLGLIFDYLSTRLSQDKYLDLNLDESFYKKVREIWNEAYISRGMKYNNSLRCLENIIENFKEESDTSCEEVINENQENLEKKVIDKKTKSNTFSTVEKKKYNGKSKVIYAKVETIKNEEKANRNKNKDGVDLSLVYNGYIKNSNSREELFEFLLENNKTYELNQHSFNRFKSEISNNWQEAFDSGQMSDYETAQKQLDLIICERK